MNQANTQLTAAASASNAPNGYSARRQLMAAMIGNVLEYYDFIVYAFLAETLARNFFRGVWTASSAADYHFRHGARHGRHRHSASAF